MVPFAGYNMPLHYPPGILAEHTHVRQAAGLFDVSHMGQILLEGETASAIQNFLQHITPSNFTHSVHGECQYTVLCNTSGGIEDDLITLRLDDTSFLLTVNAATKQADVAYLQNLAPAGITIKLLNRAILALQGPKAAHVMAQFAPGANIEDLPPMFATMLELGGVPLLISRTGYTGEDGFELSMPPEIAADVWHLLLDQPHVQPIGLAARDSLRLEAGFPLYGNDLSPTTTVVEAGLKWLCRHENLETCLGGPLLQQQLQHGTSHKRVGLVLNTAGVARAGALVFATDGQTQLGSLTSGGFAPSLQKSIGMAYLPHSYTTPGTQVLVLVRQKMLPATVHTVRFYRARQS